MRKRILSLILVLFMFCAFAPCIHAAEIVDSGECGAKGDNLTWTLDSEGTLTISGEGRMMGFDYVGAEAPLPPWQKYKSNIHSVIVEEGVTNISCYAFYRVYSLNELNIPNSITEIGFGAFTSSVIMKTYYCGKKSEWEAVNISNSGLETRTIDYVPKMIELEMGKEYSMESGENLGINLPKDTYYKISIICDDNIYWKLSINNSSQSALGSGEIKRYCQIGMFEFQITLYDKSPYEDGKEINANYKIKIDFFETSGKCGDNIEWSIDKDGTLSIIGNGEMYDFENYSPWQSYASHIQNITISEGITTIGASAFSCCSNVPSITLPNSLMSVGDYAFYRCSGLTSITIPSGIESIGESIFSDCNELNNIYVNSENNHFCSIDGVLFNKDLTKLIIYPIGRHDIEYNIPVNTEVIGEFAFSGCSDLQNITIPNTVTYIDDYAFNYTGLTSLRIPASVKYIGNGAIDWCDNLKEMYIEKGVEEIKNLVWLSGGLKEIYYSGSQDNWENVSVENVSGWFDNVIVYTGATGTTTPQIGDLTLVGSGLSSGIADLIKVSLTDTDYDSTMLTVFYKDGAMVDMQTTPIQSGDEIKDIPIPENSGADKAKVFIWDGLDGMKPLCEAKEIKIDEGDI